MFKIACIAVATLAASSVWAHDRVDASAIKDQLITQFKTFNQEQILDLTNQSADSARIFIKAMSVNTFASKPKDEANAVSIICQDKKASISVSLFKCEKPILKIFAGIASAGLSTEGVQATVLAVVVESMHTAKSQVNLADVSEMTTDAIYRLITANP